jgi:hypothetical protein
VPGHHFDFRTTEMQNTISSMIQSRATMPAASPSRRFPPLKRTSLKVAPAKDAYWGAGIPKNSPKEERARYKLINFFSLPDVQ